MELSKRLSLVAGEVSVRSICDVGTDHAYIPIYLLLNKKIDYATASDINKGPLKKAEENARTYNLLDKLSLKLSAGLSEISENEAEGLVIAGMGGMLICSILKENEKKTKSFKQLVLQPQLDIGEVRKCVHSLGYKIINEIFLNDMGKFYTVIKCEKGFEKYENDLFYEYGKVLIDKKDELYKNYLKNRLSKLEKILVSLKENLKDDDDIKKSRIQELTKETNDIKEVISWL